jgi:hypothetical protein
MNSNSKPRTLSEWQEKLFQVNICHYSSVFLNRFLGNHVKLQKWLQLMRRLILDGKPWTLSPHNTICSKHCFENMFDQTSQTVQLQDHAVPIIFYFPKHLKVGWLIFNLLKWSICQWLGRQENHETTRLWPVSGMFGDNWPSIQFVIILLYS